MSKDMKVIYENYRKGSLLQEADIQNVGQLKKLIKMHRAKEAGKDVGVKAVEMAVEQIPVVNNLFAIWKGVKDSGELLKKLYGADDDFKTNTGLDMLNINDNVSKIVDDRVETAFLNDLLKMISEMDDNEPIPNVEQRLQQFLKTKFDQHSVEK